MSWTDYLVDSTGIGAAGWLYGKATGQSNPVTAAFNQINPFSQPSTAGVQQAATDAQNIQNQFLGQYSALQPGQAPTMSAAQLSSAQAAAANPVAAQQMQAAQLNAAQSAQDRASQLALAGSLQGTINGTAPSVAQQQQALMFQQLAAQQAGQAAAAGRGGNQALAARTAAQNMAQLGGQAGAQAALLRAQEVQGAQGQLGGLLSNVSGQDLSLAAQNAQLAQQAGLTNAQLGQQAAFQNQANQQAVNLQNAQNAQASLSQNAQQQQQANAANQAAQLQTTNQYIQQQQNLGSLANTANSNQVNAQVGALNALNQQKQNSNNLLSTGISAAALSDREAKTDIHPLDSSAFDEMASQIQPATWRYRNAPAGSGRLPGAIAQDVQKSRLGAMLVRETPSGKAIDLPSTTNALLAMVSDLSRRVQAVEGKGPPEVRRPQPTAAGRKAA